LAARFECGAVHVNLPHRSIGENQVDSGLLRAFQAHGHDVKHLGLCKTLSTP
jgi:hypothetical protein